MALISCPECSHQVSDAATSCPACGHPIANRSSAPQTVVIQKPPRSRGVYIILGILGGLLGIHNFYAGYYARGAIQVLLTLILGWVIVGIVINVIWILIELLSQDHDADGQLMI
jgi:TM2 domain-containing membrane protein YozV